MDQGFGSRSSDGYNPMSPPTPATPDRFGPNPYFMGSSSPPTPMGLSNMWMSQPGFSNQTTPSPATPSTFSPKYSAPPGVPGGAPLFPLIPMRQDSEEMGEGTTSNCNRPTLQRQTSDYDNEQSTPQETGGNNNSTSAQNCISPTGGPPGPAMLPPPPPPPPPPPGSSGAVPTWKEKQMAEKKSESGYHPSQNSAETPSDGNNRPFSYLPAAGALPAALHSTLSKDKKPFTYTPGGIDLSEIRSPRIQRRISANQQPPPIAPKPNGNVSPQVVQAEVHAPQNHDPRVMQSAGRPQQVLPAFDPSQAARQLEGLNLHSGGGRGRGPPYYQPNEAYNTGSLPRNYHGQLPQSPQPYDNNFPQSKSFKILQMVTGTEKEAENQQAEPAQNNKREEDEMRFRGLRKDQQIPSRSFQTLQRMTSTEGPTPRSPQPYYGYPNESYEQHRPPSDGPSEEGPVDIRYLGGNIPSRSFKMLQEMTDSGVPPSVWQQQHHQQYPAHQSPVRKTSRTQVTPTQANPGARQVQPNYNPNTYVHPVTSEIHFPSKVFPRPDVPASLQQTDPDPKKYTGGRIPSQSFRILQAMTGESSRDGKY